MIRLCFAALIALGGMIAVAPAQIYTSYYSPGYTTYYHAPAAYSSYSYTTGYRPLGGLFDWRWWSGTAYTSPYYTSYSPSYTVGYSPVTSYYAPVADTTLAYAPSLGISSACCTPCCTPCNPCVACAGGTCASGNCSLNYAPGDLSPQPDPGTSGSRIYRSESNDAPSSSDPQRYDRQQDVPDDGFNPRGERGAGYRPESTIQQKAPTDVDEPAESGTPEAAEPEAEESFQVPTGDPDAAIPLLNLDRQLTQAPYLLRERRSLRARFGSPMLARANVDPAELPASATVQLVKK